MHLADCTPCVNDRHALSFQAPGFGRHVGEISPWCEGFCPSRVRNGATEISRHWALVIFPNEKSRPLPDCVRSFIDQVPAEVREFVSRHQFGQAMMAHCLAVIPAARDLCDSNPVLFFLLIASLFDDDHSVEEIAEICSRRQVAILEHINGSATKAAVKLLRKIDIGKGKLDDARAILRALGEPRVVALAAHQSRVSVGFLAMLCNYPDLAETVPANVFARIVRDPANRRESSRDIATHIVDVVRIGRAMGIERADQALSRCKTIDDVERLHDRWVEKLNNGDDRRASSQALMTRLREIQERARRAERPPHTLVHPRPETVQGPPPRNADFLEIPAFLRAAVPRWRKSPEEFRFPPQPAPDSEDIKAITTVNGLRLEGLEQQNCVASYASMVAAGDRYIYKVLRPWRGTLELRHVGGVWLIGQFKLKKNARPPRAAREFVDRWYQQVQWNK